jgi:carbon-monoxide dehydrogenase medium subunit
MRTFAYERPTHLDEAVALLAEAGSDAWPLAGGTDLIIRFRDGTIRPRTVVDVRHRRARLPQAPSPTGDCASGPGP